MDVVAVRRKNSNKGPKRKTAIEAEKSQGGRNWAEENQHEQGRSGRYSKLRRQNSSGFIALAERPAASDDTTRGPSLPPPPNPPQKPPFLGSFSLHAAGPAGQEGQRTGEKGGNFLGEKAAVALAGGSGYSEALCGAGVWTERRCRR